MKHEVVSMENYTATDKVPLDKCLEDVRSCDLYVGLFAWRYGYVPPGETRSITESELAEATSQGIPILVFLLDDDAPWPMNHVDSDRTNIERLRSDLSRNKLVQFFTTAEGLAGDVAASVANERQRLIESNVGGDAQQFFVDQVDLVLQREPLNDSIITEENCEKALITISKKLHEDLGNKT